MERRHSGQLGYVWRGRSWKTSADTSLCLKLGQSRGTQRTAGIVTAFRVHFGYIHWARAAMVAGQLLKSTGGATVVG